MLEFQEFRQNIKDELFVQAGDLYWSDTLIDRYIKRAYNAIGNLYKYTETQKVQYRTADSTDEGNKYFDYPNYWIKDSIFMVKINGEELKKVNWKHYQEEPGTFSEFRNKIHIPQELKFGDEIEIHGHQRAWWDNGADGTYTPADTDKSIFEQTLDEAITLYALGLLYRRQYGNNLQVGQTFIQDAIAIARAYFEQQPTDLYTGQARVEIVN